MNSVKRHTEYVDALTKLVKDSKEETRKKLLDRLAFLSTKAQGNPDLFQRLVAADRKNMFRKLLPLILENKNAAAELGRQFGKDRASGTQV